MVESDDDDSSDLSSCSHDVFETDRNIEIYEDLMLTWYPISTVTF